MKKLLVANWKMNMDEKSISSFFSLFNSKYSSEREAWFAPQSLHLHKVKALKPSHSKIGLQDISSLEKGAYTGELSPLTLLECGGEFSLIGHSERRTLHLESSVTTQLKVKNCLKNKIIPILCVGETLGERDAGETLRIIENQLSIGLSDSTHLVTDSNLIIAYEPVWAIGTGRTASAKDAQGVHAHIRNLLLKFYPNYGEKIKILYGGSLKPDNVEELFKQKDIDGGLVGGASLKAQDFLALCQD